MSTEQLKLCLDALGTAIEGDDAVAPPSLGEATTSCAALRGSTTVGRRSGNGEAGAAAAIAATAARALPRIENPIAVPAVGRPCPACGAERVCIGHDVTEVIELEPARVVVRLDAREKLACTTCEGEIVRAPTGDKVVSGGRLGSTLVAALLVDKYDDGLPLHRQKRRFERMGLSLSVSTLADQVTWGTDLLRPLWRAAIAGVLGAKVMHVDATGLPVVDAEATGGKRLRAL